MVIFRSPRSERPLAAAPVAVPGERPHIADDVGAGVGGVAPAAHLQIYDFGLSVETEPLAELGALLSMSLKGNAMGVVVGRNRFPGQLGIEVSGLGRDDGAAETILIPTRSGDTAQELLQRLADRIILLSPYGARVSPTKLTVLAAAAKPMAQKLAAAAGWTMGARLPQLNELDPLRVADQRRELVFDHRDVYNNRAVFYHLRDDPRTLVRTEMLDHSYRVEIFTRGEVGPGRLVRHEVSTSPEPGAS